MAKLELGKLVDYLEEKWGDHPCPMCEASDWGIATSVYELREHFGEGFMQGLLIALCFYQLGCLIYIF